MAGRLLIVFARDSDSSEPDHAFDMALTPHDTQNVAEAFRGVKGMIIGGEILGTIAHAIRNISELHWRKEPPIVVVTDLTREEEPVDLGDGFVSDPAAFDPPAGEPGSIESPIPAQGDPGDETPQEEPDAEAKPESRKKKKRQAAS